MKNSAWRTLGIKPATVVMLGFPDTAEQYGGAFPVIPEGNCFYFAGLPDMQPACRGRLCFLPRIIVGSKRFKVFKTSLQREKNLFHPTSGPQKTSREKFWGYIKPSGSKRPTSHSSFSACTAGRRSSDMRWQHSYSAVLRVRSCYGKVPGIFSANSENS